MNYPLVIAHRGDPSAALENSLSAIHHALSYPVDMIEIDIRKSQDNILYVMHDRSSFRTTGSSIHIEKSISNDIARIKLKNGEPIPTLTDVIKIISGRAGLNLEIKSDNAGLLTAEYLASSDYQGYVLVSSFKEDELLAVRRVLPGLPVSMIFDVFTSHDVPSYRAKGYKIISLRKTTISKKLVDRCHEHGIQVYVWTVDDEEEMKKMIFLQVDGIYSNKPGELKKLIAKLRDASQSDRE
jgi:glycerophosphoryl diester phosphodiesterase